jgi:hypothetical protein
MSHPVILAQSKIGNDQIVIELVDPPRSPATVTITWPSQPISISDRRFSGFAASMTTLFANAAMELARIKAGDRR